LSIENRKDYRGGHDRQERRNAENAGAIYCRKTMEGTEKNFKKLQACGLREVTNQQ